LEGSEADILTPTLQPWRLQGLLISVYMSFLQLIEIDCDLTEAMIDEALIVFK